MKSKILFLVAIISIGISSMSSSTFTTITKSFVELKEGISANLTPQTSEVVVISNLEVIPDPEIETDKSIEKAVKEITDEDQYILRFKEVAISEMKKFGIPASIKLAQGIHESGVIRDVGISTLANIDNNHFGIKFSQSFMKTLINKRIKFSVVSKCNDKREDCALYFSFNTPWDCYRAHSWFLERPIYKKLKKIPKSDYKAWAKGLQEAGYATDKHYAKKLIKTIEELNLQEFDH